MDWLNRAQDCNKGWAPVNTVMKLRIKKMSQI